jgi:hypothetical protein
MGKLYDAVNKVEALIKSAGLAGPDFFKAKGQISMKAGFVLTTINDKSPDDPAKIAALKAADKAILGRDL